MTTDTERTARQIINTYELHPEIEEEFRQGIFPFLEFLQLYAECTLEARQLLDLVLAKV